MFSKTVFTFAFVAAAQLVAALPPACLLGAVNTYDKPSDISSVCKEKGVTGTINKFCGDSTQQALSAFADICGNAGVEVSTEISSSTASATASSSKPSGTDSSASHSGSATPTASGATTLVTGTPTGTGAANSPSQTGGAGPNGESPSATGSSTGAPAQSTGAAGRLEVAGAGVALLAGVFAAFL